MKTIISMIFTVFLLTLTTYSQQNNASWDKLNYLIGNQKGEGSGKPGEGEGYFSFKLDLDQNILVRTSHSEYPATQDRPATNHDDLMIIYRDDSGNPISAIYFDNENHVINYSITFSNNKDIVFTSDKIPDAPLFRLTYSIVDDITVNIRFEMSRDGENFFTYIEGKAKRVEE